MSDESQGEGWYQAINGKWYPPRQGVAASTTTALTREERMAINLELAAQHLRTIKNLLWFFLIASIVVGVIVAVAANGNSSGY